MSLISIISANYNKADFISEMIESVIAQTYNNWELIIVDDCSSDNSVKIIQDYCKDDSRIKLLENKVNKGGNYSRNSGLYESNGQYIIFLDSDDILTSNCLDDRLDFSIRYSDYDAWVFSMGVFKYEIEDCDSSQYWNKKSDDFIGDFLRHNLPWAICQPLWRSTFLRKIEGFDLSFVRLQDVELHTRALLNNGRFCFKNKVNVDCYYRINEDRNALNSFNFLINFSNGAIQYYEKFYPIVNKRQKIILTGTLIETLSNICFQKRMGKITKNEFSQLSYNLINTCRNSRQKLILNLYLWLEKISPFHPKGLKKIIQLLSGV